MIDENALWSATRKKHLCMFESVRVMQVKQKRNLFGILRTAQDVTVNTFMPSFGLHCGEFACYQILAERSRKESKDNTSG